MWPRFINRMLPPKRVEKDLDASAYDRARQGAPRRDPGRAARSNPEPFVLLLRTFGEDGDIRVGNSKEGPGFEKNTLEFIVARVAKTRDMPVIALHDEKAKFVPEGVDYYVTEHDQWFDRFCQLADDASVIVILSVGELDLGDGFGDELAELRDSTNSGKVLLLFPPNLGSKRHRKKEQIFRALGWSAPPALPLVAYGNEQAGKPYVHSSIGAADDSLANRYAFGLESALGLIVDGQPPV